MTFSFVTLLAVLALALAFFNGANDVSKGIATLVGSGVTRMRTAVIWGTVWTVAGGLTAAVFSHGLVKAFSGSGIMPDFPVGESLLLCVAAGAVLWIGIATWTGMPVSTTHAITGGLIGAGLVAVGTTGIRWDILGSSFLLPLALSPVAALGLMWGLFPLVRRLLAPWQQHCVCVDEDMAAVSLQSNAATGVTAQTGIVVGKAAECEGRATIARMNLMDSLHWLSAAATSFARGLNDAPKILGIGIVASVALEIPTMIAFAAVAAAMGIGSLIGGFRVTRTLARRVTPMSPLEGFVANVITATVVIFASRLAVPVSTTHVSSGAIIGLGLERDPSGIRWTTVRNMLMAWLVTLPAAGALAALAFLILHHPA